MKYTKLSLYKMENNVKFIWNILQQEVLQNYDFINKLIELIYKNIRGDNCYSLIYETFLKEKFIISNANNNRDFLNESLINPNEKKKKLFQF